MENLGRELRKKRRALRLKVTDMERITGIPAVTWRSWETDDDKATSRRTPNYPFVILRLLELGRDLEDLSGLDIGIGRSIRTGGKKIGW